MSEFEKWYKEKYYKYDLYPKYAQFRKEMKEVWQAATAESDKRIAELEAKYLAISDSFESENTDLQAFIRELSASINVLRENLDYAYYEVNTHFAKNIKDLLASTPAQSLIQHDNEVIERCAKVCDDNALGVLAIHIRALKHPS